MFIPFQKMNKSQDGSLSNASDQDGIPETMPKTGGKTSQMMVAMEEVTEDNMGRHQESLQTS